jgi:hypothetical protein
MYQEHLTAKKSTPLAINNPDLIKISEEKVNE